MLRIDMGWCELRSKPRGGHRGGGRSSSWRSPTRCARGWSRLCSCVVSALALIRVPFPWPASLASSSESLWAWPSTTRAQPKTHTCFHLQISQPNDTQIFPRPCLIQTQLKQVTTRL